ncbi:MAG: hypothetical protein KAQ69_06795 [Spirochaetales bacterium]|nr:hypothetical protein [Spirochaetales bacterium]
MSKIFKRLITIISGIILATVLVLFFVKIAGILNISVRSSILVYDLLQNLFPILLSILFIITALLFRPASARKIPEHEPLLITHADSFLYNIPPDEPYMPLITYTPEVRTTQEQRSTESEKDSLGNGEPEAIVGKDELSFFQGLENVEDEEVSVHVEDKPDETKNYPSEPIHSKKPENQVTRDLNKPNLFSIRINPSKATKQDQEPPPVKEVFEDTFAARLEKEGLYANEQEYDISLALIRLRYKDKNKQNKQLPIYEQAIHDFLGESSYIYKYKENVVNCYALILPFSAYSETQEELISLYRYMKDALDENELIFSCGFTSRFGRKLESEVLMREAESSLKKALRKRSFSMLGFEPDLNTFNTNI